MSVSNHLNKVPLSYIPSREEVMLILKKWITKETIYFAQFESFGIFEVRYSLLYIAETLKILYRIPREEKSLTNFESRELKKILRYFTYRAKKKGIGIEYVDGKNFMPIPTVSKNEKRYNIQPL